MEFEEVLEKVRNEEITREEALFLFKEAKKYDEILELFKVACKVREEEIGSTFELIGCLGPVAPCTLDPLCKYCWVTNPKMAWSEESILTEEEISTGAEAIEETGVSSVHIGGGTTLGAEGKEVIDAAKAIRKNTDLKIRVAVGPALSVETLKELKKIGVIEVAGNFETLNEKLFREIKPGDSLEGRKKLAKELNDLGIGILGSLMVGMSELMEGGIEEPYEDYVDHMFYAKQFENLSCFGIYGFIPFPGTQIENNLPPSPLEVAKVGAIARLIFRNVNIDIMTGDVPLQILAGGNQSRFGVVDVQKRAVSWKSMLGAKTKKVNNFELINSLPVIAKFVRDAGMDVEPAIANKYLR